MKEWQEFKIALCESLKLDKFIKLISKTLKKIKRRKRNAKNKR